MAIITRIIGPSGGGKTKLLEALAVSLKAHGVRFVHSTGYSTISGITQHMESIGASTLLIDGCSEASLSLIESWESNGGPLYVYAVVSEGGRSESEIVAPAAAWTGEGLPPAGLLVEACWTSTEGTYSTAWTVGRDPEGQLIYKLLKTPTGELEGEYFPAIENTMLSGPGGKKIPKFRPVRTPEQIALEERNQRVSEIMGIVKGLDLRFLTDSHAHHVAIALYDAGYRKVEGGAQ